MDNAGLHEEDEIYANKRQQCFVASQETIARVKGSDVHALVAHSDL